MSIPTLVLSVLILLRLLMPPGICACKLTSPALRLLFALHGGEPPLAPVEPEDDDHEPGCPASYMSQGLGVAPPSGPGPLLLCLIGSLDTPAAPALSSATNLFPFSDALPRASAPPYVEHCALRL